MPRDLLVYLIYILHTFTDPIGEKLLLSWEVYPGVAWIHAVSYTHLTLPTN